MGALYMAAIIAVSIGIGWLIHDRWHEYQLAVDAEAEQRAQQARAQFHAVHAVPAFRVIRRPVDWEESRWG